MNTSKKPTSLAGYWTGIHKALDGRLESVREYLKHPSSGLNAESYFRDLIRQYLPRRFTVEAGFVVNALGERSDFLDLLIVDSLNIAPLSAEPHFKTFPAESVVGAIEITSAPKAMVKASGESEKIPKLQDDILRLARLRKIAKDREYLESIVTVEKREISIKEINVGVTLSPRSFLVTFGDEWSKSETYEKHLLAALFAAEEKNSHTWLNAVFSMRHGMMHFRPHSRFESSWVRENSLLEFIFFVNRAVSDFRPARIDVRRYRPTIPGAN